jgi:hypothetical protein
MKALTLIAWAVLSSGELVWETTLSLSGGQKRSFRLKGLEPGGAYVLESRGRCEHQPQWGRFGRWRARVNPTPPDPFGVVYRVTVGNESFSVDQEERRTTFHAESAEPLLTVEDRSDHTPGVTCSLTSLRVSRAW